MPITNYTDLQSSVQEFMHRTDLASLMPDFVNRAELSIFRELDIKDTQLVITGTTVNDYVVLPADFDAVVRLSVSVDGYERTLDYTPRTIDSLAIVSQPNYYTLENNKLRIFGAVNGSAYTLYYTPNITPLSVANPTNWLLTNASDLYLYATAMEASRHVRDFELASSLKGSVSEMINAVRSKSNNRGQPSAGNMRIKPRRLI